ncbi:FixH family protein [Methylorubrum populi]|uniref:FixH family protein n=1 Tax=Methylorubrum rhodesianum TaxID=29427 RepID=A0ABU9Z7R3_9HYPH|nr:FixH family protein [Methylorubrum rhodesianum]MBK3402908.1 FixH family protein [Methylorubrum rhodesianum]MBY0143109.1 FixH family protein [Methylorubrum populi]HEV2541946.1 FixH family protein [Methylobacterium sp.]
MTATASPPRPSPSTGLTGRTVFAIFAAFFGTIACADAFLVTSAVRTWSGLEEPSPYRASQRYNAELERARAQSAQGWILDGKVAREGHTGAAVTVSLRAADAAPLTGRTLRARLERPTDKRADRTLVVTETAPGLYAGHLPAVSSGQWELVVEVLDGDDVAFRRRHRVILD